MRNDRGSVLLTDALVSMLIGSILLSGMLGVMWLSVKLVHTAPPDHNPTVYGTLISGTARLEDSLVAPLECTNPSSATTRSDCLTVVAGSIQPLPETDEPTELSAFTNDAACWVVANDSVDTSDKRVLECWQLLDTGYLTAWVYRSPDVDDPNTAGIIEDNSDLLKIGVWQPSSDPELSRSVASGLKAVKWEHKPTEDVVEFHACASIKPDQRNLMETGFIPYCDGTIGETLLGGANRTEPDPFLPGTTIEGYRLPIIRLEL